MLHAVRLHNLFVRIKYEPLTKPFQDLLRECQALQPRGSNVDPFSIIDKDASRDWWEHLAHLHVTVPEKVQQQIAGITMHVDEPQVLLRLHKRFHTFVA
jgi:hypothetical protein